MRFLAHLSLSLALLAGALAPSAGAEDATLREEARSMVEVRAEGDGVVARSVNRSFRVVTIYPPGQPYPRTLLLAQETDVVRSTVEEGPRSAWVRLDVSAIVAAKRRPPFRIDEEGEAGAVADISAGLPFYQVTRYGCCGARDSVSTWSLVSGRRLFSATGPIASFDVPNSDGIRRLVAVHAAYSTDDARVFGERRGAAAIVTYASPTEPLRRILVRVQAPATLDGVIGDPKAMLLLDGSLEPVTSTTLWRSDGRREREAIAGLSVVVEFTPGNAVNIPVVGDDLDLAHATVPARFALEPVGLDPLPSSCSCRPPRRLFPPEAGDSEDETDGRADAD